MIELLYMNVTMFENAELFDKCMALISSDRKEKIKKLTNPAPARLSLGAGILLRLAMEKCGCADHLNNIKYGKFGKPYFENLDFHFSLSHSGEYVICVYSDTPVGADLQRIKEKLPLHTNKILSCEEKEYLNDQNQSDPVNLFFQLWAKKESLIKWDGRGLRLPLHQLSFVSNNTVCNTILFQNKKLYFHDITILMPEYALCICSDNEIHLDHCIEITEKFLTNY